MLSFISSVRQGITGERWVDEAFVAFCTDEKQNHTRLLAFRLVLVENSTSSTKRAFEQLKELELTFDSLFVTALWTRDVGVRLENKYILPKYHLGSVHTSVGSEPKSVVTPTCSLSSDTFLVPSSQIASKRIKKG